MAKKKRTRNTVLVKFVVESPRSRTIRVGHEGDLFKRVHLPDQSVAMTTQIIMADHENGPVVMHAWSVPANKPVEPNTILLKHPLNSLDGMTHVYANGICCFADTATEQLFKGENPTVVFWGSTMSVLPRWMTGAKARGETDRSWTAPRRTPAGPIGWTMNNTPHDPDKPSTPHAALKSMSEQYMSAYGSNYEYEIEAPWLKKPRIFESHEALVQWIAKGAKEEK